MALAYYTYLPWLRRGAASAIKVKVGLKPLEVGKSEPSAA